MSWALQRRLLIIGSIALVIAAGIGAFYFFAVHQPPSCTDKKQNQDETGIDCGGSCTYLCTAEQAPLSVRFVRAVSPVPGRTDIIAYVDNPNHASRALEAPYTIELYDDANVLVSRKQGIVTLPPASTVPLFVPNFFSGSQIVARAFLTFDEANTKWIPDTSEQVRPRVGESVIENTSAPRITTTVTNPTAQALENVKFAIAVYNASSTVMAASQTVAPLIPAQGSARIVFTWPAPFEGAVSRVEIVPLPLLP